MKSLFNSRAFTNVLLSVILGILILTFFNTKEAFRKINNELSSIDANIEWLE